MLRNTIGNDNARLFISINLDASFFSNIQEKLLSVHSYAKISPVKDFHLTLRFLGDKKREEIDKICESLSKVLFSKFILSFEKIDYFTRREPYVIFAKINSSQELIVLKNEIDVIFPKDKFFHSSEEFSPHVTLMRIKDVTNKELCFSYVSKVKIDTEKKFLIDKFYLMESVLTEFGPIYNVVKSFDCKK